MILNPKKKFAPSKGIDLPLMYVYLAGRISGQNIEACLAWRKQIVNYYANYNKKGAYPISFLDALNSKEADSIDKLGLKSAIPPKLILDKDLLSIHKADVVVANMDDFMELGIEYQMKINEETEYSDNASDHDYKKLFFDLQERIRDRRPNLGTTCEIWDAIKMRKPTVLIVPEKQKFIYQDHPFMREASVVVGSVEELLESKWLNILYKSMSGSTYE